MLFDRVDILSVGMLGKHRHWVECSALKPVVQKLVSFHAAQNIEKFFAPS